MAGKRSSLLLSTEGLVGAGRFERPTPCAQGGFRPRAEIPCFQVLTFQSDTAALLKSVDSGGIRRESAATKSTTVEKLILYPSQPSDSSSRWCLLRCDCEG
jgi:hypothetical protein